MSKQQLLDALLGLVAIDSVAMIDADDAHPYGVGPARALDYVMHLCAELGIRTGSLDGKVAWAEIGQGEEIVGILSHLDVVPAGEGWTHNPKGEVCGDRLYGRGVVDDKGPTIAVLFAMRELQEANVPLHRRIRLILGQSEETGCWDDMAYYGDHEQKPVFGFTPDADFPAIYGEKGILNFELSMPLEGSGVLYAEGGDAGNMVPAWCRVTVEGSNGPQTLKVEGKSAHASTPQKGLNAISVMMDQLGQLGFEGKFLEFYNRHIGYDVHGSKMGCGLEDDRSGLLTLNAGLLRTADDRLTLTLDIRNPVTFTRADVQEALEKTCAPYGISVACTEDMAPIYMEKEGEVVQAMVSVYREVTGDPSEPVVIGGGTYARAMPGIVAFGPMQPGRECTEHQKDEYILLEDLFQAAEIYRRTMERLANLEISY